MASERERDAEMDRLLRAVLREEPAGVAGACPLPDELSAYVERTLPAAERDALETHFDTCTRCQEALSLLATMPAPSVEAAVSWWRAGWKRWLVPVTAVASAVILYVALRPDPTFRAALPLPQRSVAAPAPSAAEAQPSPSADERSAAARPVPAPPASPPSSPGRRESPEGSSRAKVETSAPDLERQVNKPAAETPGLEAKAQPSTIAPRENLQKQEPAPAPVAALADARVPPAPAPVPPVPPPAPASGSEPKKLAGQAPAAGGGVAGEVVGGVAEDAGKNLARERADRSFSATAAPVAASEAAVLISAADGSPARWRLAAGGRILGSADAGRTWTLQHSAGGRLTAGSSPSPLVCWVVGSGGLVLRTTDGKTWERLPFPEPLDLFRVTAASAGQATVFSRTGKSLTTDDGGKTWHPGL